MLIIAVGHVDNDPGASLIGMSKTVERLYDWWREAAPARARVSHLVGSIDVLAIGDKKLKLTTGIGRSAPPLPRMDAVKAALQSWIERVREGGMGVLHWIGHGGTIAVSGGPLDVLFCHDTLNGVPNAIDWPSTLQGIKSLSGHARVLCFIDACRGRVAAQSSEPGLRGYIISRSPNPVFVHHSSIEGEDSYSHPHAVPDMRFEGGPITTNCVIDALDTFGASEDPSDNAYGASADALVKAVKYRRERLLRRITRAAPKWTPESVHPAWTDNVLLAIPAPHCMLDVGVPSNEQPANFCCEVTRSSDGGQHLVRAGFEGFECEVDYGEHRVTLDEKVAGRKHVLLDKPYTLKAPYRRLASRR